MQQRLSAKLPARARAWRMGSSQTMRLMMDHMVDTKSSTVPSRKRSSIAATRCSDSLSSRRSLCMDYAVDARSHAADQTSKRMCARDRPCTRMSFHTGRGSTRTCRRAGSLQVLAVQGGSAQRQSGVQSRIRRQVPGSGLWFVARVRGNLRMGCAARTLQRLWRQCHLGDEHRNNAEDHRRHDANGGEEALESRSGSAPKILSRAHAEAKQTAHRLNTPRCMCMPTPLRLAQRTRTARAGRQV